MASIMMQQIEGLQPHHNTNSTLKPTTPYLLAAASTRSIDVVGNADGARRTPLFPTMLYDMLEDVERHGLDHIVSWSRPVACSNIVSWGELTQQGAIMPACHSFRIHNIEQFELFVLPKYFKTNKYKSFQRNLNIHKFSRVRAREYAHPHLARGQRDLCTRIKRSPIKSACSHEEIHKSLSLASSSSPFLLGSSKKLMEHQKSCFQQQQEEEADHKKQQALSSASTTSPPKAVLSFEQALPARWMDAISDTELRDILTVTDPGDDFVSSKNGQGTPCLIMEGCDDEGCVVSPKKVVIVGQQSKGSHAWMDAHSVELLEFATGVVKGW